MPGQLEQAHDADYGEELHDVGVLEVGGVPAEDQVDVEAGGGDVVDYVHGGVDELALVGRGDEADEDLEGEPTNTNNNTNKVPSTFSMSSDNVVGPRSSTTKSRRDQQNLALRERSQKTNTA